MKALTLGAFAVTAAFFRTAGAQTPIIDDFSDPSNWLLVDRSTTAVDSAVSGGKMNYMTTSSGAEEEFVVMKRTGPFLPMTQNWSLSVEAHIDPFPLDGQAEQLVDLDLFLSVG
jgi:hypothetical protein